MPFVRYFQRETVICRLLFGIFDQLSLCWKVGEERRADRVKEGKEFVQDLQDHTEHIVVVSGAFSKCSQLFQQRRRKLKLHELAPLR